MCGAFQSLPTAKVFPLMISSSVARFIFRIQYPVPRAHATCLSADYVYVTLPIGTRRLVVKIEGRPSERRMFDLTGGSGALTPALLRGRLFVEKKGQGEVPYRERETRKLEIFMKGGGAALRQGRESRVAESACSLGSAWGKAAERRNVKNPPGKEAARIWPPDPTGTW